MANLEEILKVLERIEKQGIEGAGRTTPLEDIFGNTKRLFIQFERILSSAITALSPGGVKLATTNFLKETLSVVSGIKIADALTGTVKKTFDKVVDQFKVPTVDWGKMSKGVLDPTVFVYGFHDLEPEDVETHQLVPEITEQMSKGVLDPTVFVYSFHDLEPEDVETHQLVHEITQQMSKGILPQDLMPTEVTDEDLVDVKAHKRRKPGKRKEEIGEWLAEQMGQGYLDPTPFVPDLQQISSGSAVAQEAMQVTHLGQISPGVTSLEPPPQPPKPSMTELMSVAADLPKTVERLETMGEIMSRASGELRSRLVEIHRPTTPSTLTVTSREPPPVPVTPSYTLTELMAQASQGTSTAQPPKPSMTELMAQATAQPPTPTDSMTALMSSSQMKHLDSEESPTSQPPTTERPPEPNAIYIHAMTALDTIVKALEVLPKNIADSFPYAMAAEYPPETLQADVDWAVVFKDGMTPLVDRLIEELPPKFSALSQPIPVRIVFGEPGGAKTFGPPPPPVFGPPPPPPLFGPEPPPVFGPPPPTEDPSDKNAQRRIKDRERRAKKRLAGSLAEWLSSFPPPAESQETPEEPKKLFMGNDYGGHGIPSLRGGRGGFIDAAGIVKGVAKGIGWMAGGVGKGIGWVGRGVGNFFGSTVGRGAAAFAGIGGVARGIAGLLPGAAGGLAGAVLTIPLLLVGAGIAIKKLGEAALQANFKMGEFSGGMQRVAAQWEVFQALRSQRLGDKAAPGAAALEQSMERLAKAWEPFQSFLTDLKNSILSGLSELLGALLEKIASLFGFGGGGGNATGHIGTDLTRLREEYNDRVYRGREGLPGRIIRITPGQFPAPTFP